MDHHDLESNDGFEYDKGQRYPDKTAYELTRNISVILSGNL